MKSAMIESIIVIALSLSASGAFGAVIVVPTDHSTIQAAVNAAATGDIIQVLDGTYTGSGNRDITFSGKAITIESINGPGACIIDCALAGRGFIFQSSETSSSILQGFTIQYARYYSARGGGIYCSGASPTISNCLISNCESTSGGGIAITGNASPVITDCIIDSCAVSNYGGGICVIGTSTNYAHPVLTNCTITGNSTSFQGGDFYFDSNSTVSFSGITIDGNEAHSSEFGKGGGLYISCSGSNTATVTDCTISNNISNCGILTSGGGGIACISGAITIKRCQFSGNFARASGGAIHIFQSSVTIGGAPGDGNTFSDNLAGSGCDLGSRIVGPYNARYNTFSGYYPSDYYVSPTGSFDLTGSTSLLTPITTDLYVTATGSDSNDGLSWGTAFQTLQHALSQIHASAGNPLTIHVAAGLYSDPSTGERFPLPLVNDVSIQGDDMDTTVFDADAAAAGFVGFYDNNLSVSELTVTDGDCYHGGACALSHSSPGINRCKFRQFHWNIYF